jgi:hypothetical protein
MTMHIDGQVATPEASRWLQRLCHHFSRKIEVRYDAHQGHAAFPWGTCEMRADGDGALLRFACSAAGSEELARVQYAIDEHVKLFSRKNPLTVQWGAPSGAPQA